MAGRAVLLVLLVGPVIAARDNASAAGGQDDSVKKELKALEGNWRPPCQSRQRRSLRD
jgi:hypothetical protein